MVKFSAELGRLGLLDVLVDFVSYMMVWGVGRGPNGFAAPWRFEMFNSQPDSSSIGPVSTNFDNVCDFRKSGKR